MKNHVHVPAGLDDRFRLTDIRGDLGNTQLFQFGIAVAGQAENPVPAFNQLSDDGFSQKTAAAGYQGPAYLLPVFLAAHTASFSRKILELCRMSTGK